MSGLLSVIETVGWEEPKFCVLEMSGNYRKEN